MKRLTFEKITADFNFQEYQFDCGIEELNHFFYSHAEKFVKEEYSQVYISKIKDTSEIIGFFTLSCTSIRSAEKELLSIEKIARYIPGILLGMFGVDLNYQKQGYGTDLLKKAVYLSLKTSRIVGCRCLIVDSLINERLLNFYRNIGFEFVNDSLGVELLQKLMKGISVKQNTIKLYLDLQKLQKSE